MVSHDNNPLDFEYRTDITKRRMARQRKNQTRNTLGK